MRRGYRGNSAIHHGPGNSRVVSFSSCFSPVPQSRPRSAAQDSERFPCVFRCRCMRSSSQSSLRSILWRWFWRNPAARSSVPPPDIAAHAPQGFPASNRGNVRIHGASRWLPRGRWFSGCSWWLQCSSYWAASPSGLIMVLARILAYFSARARAARFSGCLRAISM